jgi:hypothetical protein
LTQLSDTSDTLEMWVKVQMLWTSLESVFLGGDIAKQMPFEAKKFVKINKDWEKLMGRAAETKVQRFGVDTHFFASFLFILRPFSTFSLTLPSFPLLSLRWLYYAAVMKYYVLLYPFYTVSLKSVKNR